MICMLNLVQETCQKTLQNKLHEIEEINHALPNCKKEIQKILSSSTFIAYFMQRKKMSTKRIDSKNKKDTMTSKYILKLELEKKSL